MVLLESINIPLGSRAIDFSLKGTDEKIYSLEDFKGARALVIVFMCNHCPYVQAIWKRLVKLQARFEAEGVRFVGINPNLNPDYPEETFEKMKEYYARYNMNFPYLQDDLQVVAKKYEAQCTPDIYVYDGEFELKYHGRVDDNWKNEDEVLKEDLSEALKAILSGVDSERNQHPAMGCSIKWREDA